MLLWGFDPSADAEFRVPTAVPSLPSGEEFAQVAASVSEVVAVSEKNVLWRLREGKWDQMMKVGGIGCVMLKFEYALVLYVSFSSSSSLRFIRRLRVLGSGCVSELR